MKNRIFKGIFFVALAVWLACLLLIMGALYTQYSNEYALNLKNEAYVVARGVDAAGLSYFDGLKLQDNHRITWVGINGQVIYDSFTSASSMDNHGNRSEIQDAMADGYGEDTRYSKTLSEKTMYSAVRLEDGSVLRVSQTQFTIVTLLLSMSQPILVVLIIAVVLSLFLATRIAKSIVKPINQIDIEDPETTNVYEELKPLADKIAEQNLEQQRQIDQLMGDVDAKAAEAEFRREFTANVSHELKTPLTSISGFAEIIKNGIVKPEDVPGFAGKIYDEAQRLINLVGDIIKLSQLDENQVNARKEAIDIYGLCQEVIEPLKDAAAKNHISIKLQGTHAYVETVREISEEIIYNLCENAIKYNEPKGTVEVTVGRRGTEVFVTVKDTGIGIAQEELDRIFERFYRVNKSHSKEIGGTGLGLSIVKHGAAYLGAKVDVKSDVGKGTEITVTF